MKNQTELNTIWESLGISNDFMFSKIMQDVELCKEPDAGSGEYGKRYGKGKIEGRAEEIIESGFEFGLSEKDILTRLQNKLDISLQAAQQYLLRFGKQMV